MTSNQPQPSYGMSITPGGGNKNAKNLPTDSEGRDWSYDLFSCFDEVNTCVLALCCPCIVYAQNKQRLDHLNQHGTPDPTHGGEFVSADCGVHAAIRTCGFGWVLQFLVRSSVRSRYHIRGEPLSDGLTAFCCTPCELVQEAREIELEEQSFGIQKA